MADDEKGAPAGVPESAAAPAASQNGNPPVTDAPVGDETPDQKVTRLQRLLDDANALNASNKSKIEEANRLRAAQSQAASQPPNGQPASDPLDRAIHDQQADLQKLAVLAQQYPDDPIATSAYRNAAVTLATLQERKAQGMAENALRQARPVFDADKKFGAKAEQIYRAGRAASPEDALVMARGEAYAEPDPVKAAQEDADRRAREAGQGRPSTGSPGGHQPPSDRKTIGFDEYNARIAKGDRKLQREADAGLVVIDYTA